MKRFIPTLSAVVMTMALLIACNNNGPSSPPVAKDSVMNNSTRDAAALKDSIHGGSQKDLHTATEIYTCTMHNEVIGAGPGHCSVCGMELVKQKPTDQQRKLINEGTYTKPKE